MDNSTLQQVIALKNKITLLNTYIAFIDNFLSNTDLSKAVEISLKGDDLSGGYEFHNMGNIHLGEELSDAYINTLETLKTQLQQKIQEYQAELGQLGC